MLLILALALQTGAGEREELLSKAEESIRQAAERVKDDPARPSYHVLSPAQWINDPNGPLFHDGWYHLFYQHNPYGDEWGHMHWGHVRSKDLAHWERLPLALWPSKSKGEDHVFSGSAAVTKKGEVLLFYTSIGKRAPEQWVAIPEDRDLLRWKKHPANPVLAASQHGDVQVHEWRDPYVFRSIGGRAYMVCGGNLNATKGGEAAVFLYRAEDEDLLKWKYLGVLFKHPDVSVKNIECPIFFNAGAKWVLIVSPHRLPDYFTGDFDEERGTFKTEARGIVDPGHFYAPSVCPDGKGRLLLWGWVNGFPAKKGWRHCLTLPRGLGVGAAGELLQEPAPELEALRGERRMLEPGKPERLDRRAAELILGEGALVRIGKSEVSASGGKLIVAGKSVDLPAAAGRIRVFWDGTLLEVYAAGGRIAMSRVIPLEEPTVEAEGAGVELWPLRPGWK
jgi:beta-fructofuranosidase